MQHQDSDDPFIVHPPEAAGPVPLTRHHETGCEVIENGVDVSCIHEMLEDHFERKAGNTAHRSVMGTIEYAVEHRASPLNMVPGHTRCIGPMVEAIVPAAKDVMWKNGDLVQNAVIENAKRSAARIASDSKIIKGFVSEGSVKVVAVIYDLDTGCIEILS